MKLKPHLMNSITDDKFSDFGYKREHVYTRKSFLKIDVRRSPPVD